MADNNVLVPLKVLFYALTIALVAFMIGRQIALYRDAKKKGAVMVKESQGYSNDVVDLEKGRLKLGVFALMSG